MNDINGKLLQETEQWFAAESLAPGDNEFDLADFDDDFDEDFAEIADDDLEQDHQKPF